MDKQIKQKAKRIFAAMLVLTVMSGTLPYTPLSGVVGDVAITASAADSVTYIGADGTVQTITDYTLVTSYIGTETQQWSGGNYFVDGDVTISVEGNDAIYFDGTVNLILCNNAHLTITSTGSGKSAITGNKEFNIFSNIENYHSQGALIAEGDTGIKCKCLNVYGGNVTLKGTSSGLSLCNDGNSGTQGFTVNGGTVGIYGNINDSSTLYLNGGDVNICGNIEGFSTLYLNGGNVDIDGKLIGKSENAEDNIVSIGYTSPTDMYYFNDLKDNPYTSGRYTVKVAENKTVKADYRIFTGELSSSDRDYINSHAWIIPVTATVTVADGITGGTVKEDKTSEVLAGDTVTLTVTPDENYELDSLTVTSGNTTAQFTCDGLDSYMDGDTLVLKGNITVVRASNSYYAIRMPLNAAGTAPVNRDDVKHIRVDAAGATFPEIH